jgi:xanthine dehydrogenase YagR molybdenum-binding subunit
MTTDTQALIRILCCVGVTPARGDKLKYRGPQRLCTTTRSQCIGGMVGGIGMALLEHTVVDERNGRVTNGNIAEYIVPVNADVRQLEVSFVEEHDPHVNPLGMKGAGEIAQVGVAAAIANAVHHATGKRIRDLPITPEKLL